MGNKETKKGISRRDFLKGAAVSAVGVATAGLLGACGSEPTPSAIPTASVSSTPAVSGTLTGVTGAKYEIINTDLLIIGAGFSASAAAYQAIESGQRVAVIEKAPYGHGGGMGFNWDVIATWQMPDYLNQESKLKMVVNKQLYMNAGTTDPNAIMGPVLLNRGEVFHERADDGSLIWYVDYPSTKGVQGVMPRIELDTLKESQLVTVYDRTMITDVLINDGQCIGAMGVYLPTGDFRVYRSKATILATGASCWFYGWNTVSANSINSPDNTSDVDMACFRRGAGIGDAEYAAFDFATTYPEGLAYGWNTMLNPDANEYFAFADRDGVQMITEDSGVDLVRCTYDRPYFNSTLGKMMYAGAMTDAGGLLANLDGVELRPAMERNLAVFEKFGVDPYAENLPIHDEMYEHGGTPVIDDNMMSVDFPGLFCARGAGTAGADGQNNVSKNNRFGSYAARCAIDYMKSATMPETIDFTPADKEYARLQEILSRKASDGLRPYDIRHKIQKICAPAVGLLRSTDALEAAVAELERIRKEDLPRQIVSSQSSTYNTEWKEAIENYNLLDIAEITVKATLRREETRGQYLRVEFPDVDDENWKLMQVCRLENDEMAFADQVWPDVEW